MDTDVSETSTIKTLILNFPHPRMHIQNDWKQEDRKNVSYKMIKKMRTERRGEEDDERSMQLGGERRAYQFQKAYGDCTFRFLLLYSSPSSAIRVCFHFVWANFPKQRLPFCSWFCCGSYAVMSIQPQYGVLGGPIAFAFIIIQQPARTRTD